MLRLHLQGTCSTAPAVRVDGWAMGIQKEFAKDTLELMHV